MGSMIEVFRGDNGALVVNASGVDQLGLVPAGLDGSSDPTAQRVLAAMASWVGSTRPPASRRVNGIFDRDRYVNPNTTYDKIRVARAALRDDIVGGAADVTEALAHNAVSIYAADLEQQDVWNQIIADLDLDSRLREMWRTLYTDSQVVVATWWGRKTYTPRTPTASGQKNRKKYDLTVPLHLSLLDTTKVTPIGSLMFNQERLAFVASPEEAFFLDSILAARDGITPPTRGRPMGRIERRDAYGRMLLSPTVPDSGLALHDPIIERIITSRYTPPLFEAEQLRADGVDPEHLFAFDPRFVWRHTLTRPQYQRFADVRLESVFELLDLKTQLRQMDRAHLIGGANYIVLVTKGSDAHAAEQREIDNLRANVHTLGQLPVLVGDHRLSVEIVTPKMDATLDQKRHDTLDVRISARVYGTFAATGADTSDPIKAGRVISRGLESRRRMERRSFEMNVAQKIRDANPSVMTERAKLLYHPGTISLAFDSAWATFLLDMREAREISRGTLLSQMDLDQADEAAQRTREADLYDETFGTIVPHGYNGDEDGGDDGSLRRSRQRSAGRRLGGRRNGGGAAPGTRQGQETIDPRRSDTGPTKRRGAADALHEVLGLPADASTEDMVAALDGMQRPDLIAVASYFEISGRHRARAADLRLSVTAAIEAERQDA